MKTELLELNGNPFFVRFWGDPEKQPLLLLHGFPEYGGAWADLAPHLTDRFYCIAPDQRGYGQSWAPDDVSLYKTPKLVGDMMALIDQVVGGPVTVFGHDWGAAVAYGLAIMAPERTSRLIIANGVHPAPFQREMAAGGAQTEASQYILFLRQDGSEDILSANEFAKMRNLFLAKMDTDWLTPEKQDAYLTEWARDNRLKTMIHWYRASPLMVAKPGEPITDVPDLPRENLMVQCPHLLLWGDKDTALLPAATAGLEDYAPDLTRVHFADANHWICHQIPEQIAQAVKDWHPK